MSRIIATIFRRRTTEPELFYIGAGGKVISV
jgi:hypothetical protein